MKQCRLFLRHAHKIPGNMVVRPDNTTWRTIHCGCKRHFSCCSQEIWLEQHFHVMDMFSADSDDVSVWELVDKIDPPIHTESEQPPRPSSWMKQCRLFLRHAQKSLGTWSCDLTARHGVQCIADVNVTFHVARGKFGWNNTST